MRSRRSVSADTRQASVPHARTVDIGSASTHPTFALDGFDFQLYAAIFGDKSHIASKNIFSE